jgi:hypothetical protein
MENVLAYLLMAVVSLIAVAIAYRVKLLHSIVFGKGSARMNHAAELAVSAKGAA